MLFKEIWYWLVLLAFGSYFIGNINFSIMISKPRQDVRKLGSGNPGTMNMLRNYGAGLGALTLVLDIIKGIVPSLVGYLVFRGTVIQGYNIGYFCLYLAGLSVVLGHIYPVFLKFKGGKGVATAFGVFFVAEPIIMAVSLVLCIIIICVIEYGSVGSFFSLAIPAAWSATRINSIYVIGGELTVPLSAFLFTMLMVFAIVFLVYFAHRKNIYQVISGTEHKTKLRGIIAKVFKKKKKS